MTPRNLCFEDVIEHPPNGVPPERRTSYNPPQAGDDEEQWGKPRLVADTRCHASMHLDGKTLAFVLANTAAVLAALYISFASDLDRPYWAMFTVFIVAKPISGAVRSKAVFRLLGTVAGAAVALLLIPPLVQAPVLLCLATSLWIGLCLYLSLQDRRPRSYAFLLAGYTAAIVGLAVVNAPETIFDTSVARVEEISIGLVCAAVAHSVFFPQNMLEELTERIDRALRKCGTWIADALVATVSADLQAEQQLAGLVSDLHVLYEHVAFETSDVPRNASVMQALRDRLASILPRVSSVQAAVAALSAAGPITRPTVQALEAASRWARAYSTSGGMLPGDIDTELHAALARLSAEGEDGNKWSSLLERAMAIQLRQLVTELSDAARLAAALKNPYGTLADGPALEPPSRRTLPRDRGLALLSAFAAATATLVACALWIEGSWPEGAAAAQFAAIGCSLFATLDRPSKVLMAAVVGILLALPVAALYEFAIFPRIDGFPSLALVLAPMVLLFSWMQTSERLEGMALVLSIGFSGGLALQSSYQADFASFINSNTAEIVGLLIAAVANLLFRTIDPVWNAVRISRAGWQAVARLAQKPNSDIRYWTLQMFDRFGLVTQRLLSAKRKDLFGHRIDGLRDLRVGMNLAALQRSSQALPAAARQSIPPVLSTVADAYVGLLRGESLVSPDSAQAIDRGIAVLAAQTPTRTAQAGVTALVGLRLDLTPFGSRYLPRTANP
jgi:uncharacterized membrane protein YccC